MNIFWNFRAHNLTAHLFWFQNELKLKRQFLFDISKNSSDAISLILSQFIEIKFQTLAKYQHGTEKKDFN